MELNLVLNQTQVLIFLESIEKWNFYKSQKLQ
jgi:hypothetical protein